MSQNERLTDWQRNKLCEVILLGCDRTTACHYVSTTMEQLQAEMDRDEAFGRQVVQAEAQAEVRHMGNVHSAAKSEKNWRTSVWWLERRDHQRSTSEIETPAETHIRELVEALAEVIVAEIADTVVQRRLIERLLRVLAGDDDPSESFVPELRLLPAPAKAADAPSFADGEHSL